MRIREFNTSHNLLLATIWVFLSASGVVAQVDLLTSGSRITSSTFPFLESRANRPLGTATWDGGGATNNWSEAANWSGDTVPAPGDPIVFDGTSTKNATIDVSVAAGPLTITVGYTGIVTMAPGVNATFGHNSTMAGGTFNAGSGTLTLGTNGFGLNLSGGTLNGGSGPINFDSTLTQTGGTFNGGSGNVSARMRITGGTFNAPSGNLTFFASDDIFKPTTFSHGNGTFVFIGGNDNIEVNPLLQLNNLTLNKDENGVLNFTEAGRTVRVSGTLSLTEGRLSGGSGTVVKAEGPVVIGPSFGSANSNVGGGGTILIKDGSGTRAIDWPSTASLPHMRLDDSNATLTVTGVGTALAGALHVLNGAVEAASANLEIGHGASTGQGYLQSGGTFHMGTGNLTQATGAFQLNGGTFTMDSGNASFPCFLQFNIAGGTFNASSGTTTVCPDETINGINGTFAIQSTGIFNGGSGTFNINPQLVLSGGTFNASSGTMRLGFQLTRTGGTFTHGNGTIIFDSVHSAYAISVPGGANPPTDFNNVTFDLVSGSGAVSVGGNFVVNGSLTFKNGSVTSGPVQAKGNVIVDATADGGNAQLTFNGAGSQSFSNNGGANTSGTWIVDKPSGTILTAATSMILGPSQALNVTGGILYLGNGSNLTVGGILTIGANGRLANDSSTTIMLGANAVNNGRLDLQGGGATCPDSDLILLRSSVDGTRRNWSGTGFYRLSDVDVKDMGGTSASAPAITVFSGTDSGNNNTNWTFNSACALELTISPLTANVSVGGTQQFTTGGGFAPRTFSIPTNNSGATINTTTGLYTAGATSGVVDTVRVTDNFGTTADATVNVIGVATRVAFVVHPSNTIAGQTITPPVQVAIQDASGNTVTNATNAVTLVIQNNPGGGALSGTVTRNAVAGIATFNDLSINRVGVGYTLQAASPTLLPATSNSFNINVGPAVRLGFLTQPSNTDAFAPITPAVQVAIQDAAGNTVPTSTDVVNIAIESNPGGSVLSGTTSRAAVGGVATFDDLAMDRLGVGYTLRPNSGTLNSIPSDPFEITRPIFKVLNRNDSGAGSLRKAITDANAMPGPDTIHFNIPAPAPFRITPATRLPDISDAVTIDGTTQPGFSGSPIVELTGNLLVPSWNNPATGLRIRAGNCHIRGLVISNFVTAGISLAGSGGSTVRQNFIGTDVAGNASRPNYQGIQIFSANNMIGGTSPADANLISGNTDAGVYIYGGFSGNRIQGNRIGTNANGSAPLPNNGPGISGYGATKVGGILPGEANLIAFNSIAGIRTTVERGLPSFQIRGNSIHSNQGLGVDVHSLGVTWVPTFPGFPPVDIPQGFPTLYSVVSNGGMLQVRGSLWSMPFENYTLDFYSSPTCDSSGHGEGLNYVGSTTVTTPGDGLTSFIRNLSGDAPVGHFISATATRTDGSTSEFSPCQVVAQSSVTISGRALQGGAPLANTLVRLSGARSATAVTNSSGEYAFTDLASNVTYTVTVSKPNYDFAPPSRTYTNVINDQLNQDYSGVKTRFTIAGQLTGSIQGNPIPLSDVRLTLSGTISRNTTASGVYYLNDLPPGQYSLTPTKDGYIFSPPTVNVQITNADQAINFTALPGTPLPGRLVAASGGPGPLSGINADGSARGLLTYAWFDGMSMPDAVTLSRDGRKVAYTGRGLFAGPTYGRFLAIGESDGSDSVTVISPSLTLDNAFPEWSPDGSKIAFVQTSSGRKAIRIRNSDGSVVSVPTTGLTDPRHPTWLSNTRLAFSAAPAGTSVHDIFAVNINGTGLVRLTTAVGTRASYVPAASPDGTKIAFYREMSPSTGQLMVIDSNGGDPLSIRTDSKHSKPAWSPDGTFLAYQQVVAGGLGRLVAVSAATGGGARTILDAFQASSVSWGPKYSFPTPTGTNVLTSAGGASVNFASVIAAGITTFTPLTPTQLGTFPATLVAGSRAYEISTTSAFSAPVTVCVRVPTWTATTTTSFNAQSLMHLEGGVLVDRTTSRNFANRLVCAETTTLGSFVLAEQRDAISPATGAALPTIGGSVVDSTGNPLSDVLIEITGTESRIAMTDALGNFEFVNLTEGDNYNIRPRLLGYQFVEPNEILTDLTGNNSVAFIGTPANFTIAGTITKSDGMAAAGIPVILEGVVLSSVLTDSNGSYNFSDLPVDGAYSITPIGSGFFSPPSVTVNPLDGNLHGLDFTHFADAPEFVSLGGRVVTADGSGIPRARIVLTDFAGEPLMVWSNPFGYYRFDGVRPGVTYTLSIGHKQYQFPEGPYVIFVTEELTDFDLIGTQ